MKKLIALTLALLTLLAVFCACADQPVETPDDTTPADQSSPQETTPPTQETTADKYDIGDNLPELNYGGDTVTILSRGISWCKDEVSVKEINGEHINDAIYERNLAVESRLGVEIENVMTTSNSHYEATEMIRTQVNSATHDYDMMANSVYSSIMYTEEGLFQDLLQCDYLDLDQPWWAQGFNSAASIGDSQYFVSGSIALSTYRFIFATFFNRNLFSANGIDLPYDAVNNGKWTLDYQYEISSNIYVDNNGDNQKNEGDTFGFITNANMIGVDAYWSSCQLPILVKTEDNYLEYAMNVDRLETAVTKINHLIWDNPGALSIPHASADSEQDTIAQIFADSNAAMATLRLIAAESSFLRNMNDDYGIVPIPKLDEAQSEYYSYAHDVFTAYAVPVTVVDEELQQMGAVLEAMGAESHRTVLPAYYEITLKDKYCNDPESRDMLDKIISSFYIDPGVLYTKKIDSVHQKMRTFVGGNINYVASTMKALSRTVPSNLQKLLDGIKRIQN